MSFQSVAHLGLLLLSKITCTICTSVSAVGAFSHRKYLHLSVEFSPSQSSDPEKGIVSKRTHSTDFTAF